MKTQYLFILLLLTLSACGFQLRGTQQKGSASVNVSKVYVSNTGAGSIAIQVKSQLRGSGSTIVSSVTDAKYILNLSREAYEQNVLSVSAQTGKVEEYQLTLSIVMSVLDSAGKELVLGEQIQVFREYTFDEDAVLGKFAEEQVLREDLTSQAASEVLLRLNSAVNDN
jgi:LPS-assembly lipoprotein